MRKHQLIFWTTLCAIAFGGCSFLLNWSDEGRACDPAGPSCLVNYQCVDGKCVRLDSDPCRGECKTGQRCNVVTGACMDDTCKNRKCAIGRTCSEDRGTTTCANIFAPQLGHSCNSDVECEQNGANRICYFGSVQYHTGGLRSGICLEKCSNPGDVCKTDGGTCTPFSISAQSPPVHLCVMERTLFPCTRDLDCKSDDMVCTVFDHPTHGPAAFCDTPLQNKATPGQTCSHPPDTSRLCGNGLCIPRSPATGQTPVCGEVCNSSSCAAGSCVPVEFRLQNVYRHIPMCVPEVTVCKACQPSNVACGADAPDCTLFNGVNRCLSSCTPDAGGAPACPSGYRCTQLPDGPYCTPESGSCPT